MIDLDRCIELRCAYLKARAQPYRLDYAGEW